MPNPHDIVVLAAAFAAARVRRLRRLRRLPRPPILPAALAYRQFQWALDDMDPTRIQHHFRLPKEEIRRLVPLLGLEGVEWRAGRGGMWGVNPEKAFCVLLARLSFPGRWSICVDIFGRSRGWLSTVFNDTCLF